MAKKKTKGQGAPAKRSGSGGMLSGMRGGMKRVTGGGPSKPRGPWSRVLDIALWVAVIAMALYWFMRR